MSASPPLIPPFPVGNFTAEAFAQHLASRSSAPAWWLERKRAAYEKFASLPLPKRTDEPWRFSSLATLALDGYQPRADLDLSDAEVVTATAVVSHPSSPSPARTGGVPAGLLQRLEAEMPFSHFDLPSLASLLFVNNALAARSTISDDLVRRGVIVTTLSDALVHHADLLKAHFMAQPQKLGSEKFASLHAAFVGDGAFIYVPRGVELPLPILVTHAAAGPNTVVFPHTLIIAEENSKVTVVDLFASWPDVASWTHPHPSPSGPASLGPAGEKRHLAVGANDLYAGHGAQLTYAGVQDWSKEALSFQLNSTVVRRDARVQSLNLHLGGRQARHESLSQLQAPGAFSEMLALTIARGKAEFDQRTLQLHQAPNTKSDLLYKNALSDAAKTIFSGLIVVDPDAQKTDAYQSNRNLVLSDDAEADSLPGLEIHANDVRCTHGATTSRVDPEQLFYLQTRGISPEHAHQLLVFGFFEEVLNRLENEPLHDALRRLIQSQFSP